MRSSFFCCCPKDKEQKSLLSEQNNANEDTMLKKLLDEVSDRISSYQNAKNKESRDVFLFIGVSFQELNFPKLLDAVAVELMQYDGIQAIDFKPKFYETATQLLSNLKQAFDDQPKNSTTQLLQAFEDQPKDSTDMVAPLNALLDHLGMRTLAPTQAYAPPVMRMQ